jgi:hypothetical protein
MRQKAQLPYGQQSAWSNLSGLSIAFSMAEDLKGFCLFVKLATPMQLCTQINNLMVQINGSAVKPNSVYTSPIKIN